MVTSIQNVTHLAFIKSNIEQQIAYGIAMSVGFRDLQDDEFKKHSNVVFEGAHSFAKNGFTIDLEHDHYAFSKRELYVVESSVFTFDVLILQGKAILPAVPNMAIEDVFKAYNVPVTADELEQVKLSVAPTWMLGIKFVDDEIWERVKDQTRADAIRGLSIYGFSLVPKQPSKE